MISISTINEEPIKIIIEPIITNNTFKVRVEYGDRTKNFDKIVSGFIGSKEITNIINLVKEYTVPKTLPLETE